jgi:hypothetical protein
MTDETPYMVWDAAGNMSIAIGETSYQEKLSSGFYKHPDFIKKVPEPVKEPIIAPVVKVGAERFQPSKRK